MGWGSTVQLVPTITTTAPAYSSGDVVGGLISLYPGSGITGNGTVQTVHVIDTANQKQPFSIFLFTSRPVGTYTDNGALSFGAGDANLVYGPIGVLAADYVTFNSIGFACITTQVGLNWNTPADGSPPIIYCVIVTTGTPTYGASSTVFNVKLSMVMGKNP